MNFLVYFDKILHTHYYCHDQRAGKFIIGASGCDKQMLCGSSVVRAAATISAINKIQKG